MALRLVETSQDGPVDDLVADLDPDPADDVLVVDDLQLDGLAVDLLQRAGEPGVLLLREVDRGRDDGSQLLATLGRDVEVGLERAVEATTPRRQDRLAQLQATFEQRVPTHTAALDVSDAEAVAEVVAALPERFQRVHTLINNAGLALGKDPAPQASLEDWHRMIDTNIKGLVNVTKHLLPLLSASTPGATIINLGSIAANTPYPGGHVYGATKAFVRQFSLNLRADLLGTAVRVSNIEPGMAGGTEFSNVRFHGDDAQAAQVYADVQPLTAEDVAEATYWITTLPAHVNINTLAMMPTAQAFGPLAVHRG